MDKKELQNAVSALIDDDFTTGDRWRACHDLCQVNEGEVDFDWVHGLIHMIEGDRFNSDYWYRRAGRSRHSEDVRKEWAHVVDHLGQDS